MDTLHQQYNDPAAPPSSRGCLALFFLFFGITCLPLFFGNASGFIAPRYQIPALFITEFLVITPLYWVYFRQRKGMGWGAIRGNIRYFLFFFAVILLIPSMVSLLTGVPQPEKWTVSLMRADPYLFWINTLVLVLLVPVYEEMVFRGALFTLFHRDNHQSPWIPAVAVSLLFALCHLQYTDMRSFVILFLISLSLIAARLKSGGIAMPTVLHMLMNATVIGGNAFLYG